MFKGSERPTTVAIVGAGTMGAMYAQAFSQNRDVSLVAICDLDLQKAEFLGQKFGVPNIFQSLAEMLRNHSVDAIAVATPDAFHKDPVLLALSHGAHVLCEKPLALSEVDCAEMVQMAERQAKRLMVNYGNRHRPEIRLLRSEVEAGHLGPIGYAYVRLNERVEKTRTLSWIQNTNPTWFLHSHCVDLITFLLQDSVTEIYGQQYFGRVKRETGSDVPDAMIYLLKMTRGALVTLESNWSLPESFPSDVDIEVTLVGENGMLRTPLSKGIHKYGEAHSILRWDLDVTRFDGVKQGWWYDSCNYFIHCLKTGEEPRPNGSDGRYVTKVLEAMTESITSGRAVRVMEL